MYSMVLMAALTTGADMPDWGRRGGWGCCGCYGGYGWGGWGCYGYGGWGGGYGGYGYGGWGGGYGGWGGWGGGYAGWGGLGGTVYAAPVATYATPVLAAAAPVRSNTSLYYNPDPNAGRRATLVVHLPANAKLTVDGKSTRATSATRRFITPPLEAGQNYHYIFKAQIDREGEPMTVTKRVDVRAGQTRDVRITFEDQNAGAEDNPISATNRRQ